jgi:cysteine desulfurase/selenocysteine lyase
MTQIPSPWRGDFPIFSTTMHGQPLVFLDSGASAQKPQAVIEAMQAVMEGGYANIHRGLYELSQSLTASFEAVRARVARFIGAGSANEIIFTRNSTEGINLVAQSWGRTHLKAGDEILLTAMEHHANIVPWQLLCAQVGCVIKVIPVTADGRLDFPAFEKLLSKKTKLIGVVHVSNALGTVNPVEAVIKTARAYNPELKILVDGSQSAVHMAVNVRAMDADFFVFTGHKLYGPTGIGVLYGKFEVLETMPPYQGGGDMIERVRFSGTTYKEPPYRFEAGTPAIVEVIGLGAAIDYVSAIGMDAIAAHEKALLEQITPVLRSVNGLRLYGPEDTAKKAGILSFTVEGAHASDLGMILDQCGVAVRTGHHCCMPLMDALGVEATVRASFGLYTNGDDLDALIAGLEKARMLFGLGT